jgi:hypothetical protein
MPNKGATFNSILFNQAVFNAKVNIGDSPLSYDFGALAESATKATGLDYFTITNNSGFAVDVTISGTDMIGGNSWVLADDGIVGEMIYALKAGLELV